MVPQAGRPKTTKPPAMPEYLKLLAVGAAGAGKTHLFATVGKGAKVLSLDVESGSATYSSPPFLQDPAAADPGDIDIVAFPTEGPEAVKTAAELTFTVESAFDYLIRTKNADDYKVVIVDSLTEFQKRFLSLHQAPDPRQSYGALSDALYNIVLKARACPVNVVFTTRPKAAVDEVTGREIVRSDVAPSVWANISGLLDAVGYYHVRTQGAKTSRVLDFSHDARFQAKNRYGLTELVNPTMAELLEVIQKQGATLATVTSAPQAAPRRVITPRAAARQ